MTGGSRRGFTLLEMIVATALMGITVVGLLSLLSGVLSNAARIQQYDQAVMLARTKMNELLLMRPLPLGRPLAGQWDESTGWSARAEPFEDPPNPGPGALRLVRVQLEVWWTSGGERRTMQLESYRRDWFPMDFRP